MPSAFSYEEQVARLESRGLVVGDREAAIRVLSEVNCYRLRGYWLTLEDYDRFFDGMTFETIVYVYSLDKELRDWLWRAIEPVEVKLRTSFAYRTGFALGPGGHADSQYYQNKKAHEKSMKSYRREVSRAQRDGVPCVCHNLGKYGALPAFAKGGKQFMTFVVLERICERSWPDRWNEMVGQLDTLIKFHPAVDITRIGFPSDWREALTLRSVGQKGELRRNG